ncbi:hypothetical protein C0214_06190 [Methylobacterium sp. DM1]|uniref:Uncharacterized protein n=4 Tax=Methylorubrum extorquens TaxID=408 RepID=C5B3K1_METEA|nr:hypothetical protein Mchl_1011 [Methylorubrum extorquens CM4]ACS43033.1 Hypothetical protein MexAM1_META2p0104 [Methylorubrum extorquens AM1]AWI87919.1 hypothetical protein C0214_06190 [Methylobacterium sp. DM1]MCP1545928.1 hypothetical protein [Methylorubrum extorquens]MCP1591878.1 hypothetical protein [Methylorubrum extorquens]
MALGNLTPGSVPRTQDRVPVAVEAKSSSTAAAWFAGAFGIMSGCPVNGLACVMTERPFEPPAGCFAPPVGGSPRTHSRGRPRRFR